MGYSPYRLVQDFFHQQYVKKRWSSTSYFNPKVSLSNPEFSSFHDLPGVQLKGLGSPQETMQIAHGEVFRMISCLVKLTWFQCGTCHAKYVKVLWYISFPKCLARSPGFKWPLILGRMIALNMRKWIIFRRPTGFALLLPRTSVWKFFRKLQLKVELVMVANIFIFNPKIGEDSHFDSYFSKGLKPPTSSIGTCIIFSL